MTGRSTFVSPVGSTPIICGGTSLESAAELASIGEMDITASASASSEVVDGEGVGVGTVIEDEDEENEEVGGSSGIARAVSGECTPTGLRGKRRVPLFGFGTRPKESQTML